MVERIKSINTEWMKYFFEEKTQARKALSDYLATRNWINPYEMVTGVTFDKGTMELCITLSRQEKPEDSIRQDWLLNINEGNYVKAYQMRKVLGMEIENFKLSARAYNFLSGARIKYVLDLVEYEEEDVLKFRNFGKKSLDEVREKLNSHGLKFNMQIKYNLYGEEIEMLPENIDQIKIERLGLSSGTYHSLKEAEVSTLGDMVDKRYTIPLLSGFRKHSKSLLEVLQVFKTYELLSKEEEKILESKSRR